jgi:hypothetical protein
MSLIRTLDRSTESEVNQFKLRSAGSIGAWPAAPTYVDIGGTASGASTGTVAWPTEATKGDLGILVVESSGGDAAASASGWTHFSGSPVTDVADATGSKLSVLWKFAESSSPASAALADPGDHFTARIAAFRGVTKTPGKATVTDTKTTASTLATWPSISTPSPNNLVVFGASRPDDSGSTTAFSTFVASGLTGTAEAGEAGTTTGDGGGFVICYGTRAAMGSIGTSTVNITASVTNALFVVALEPSVALPA